MILDIKNIKKSFFSWVFNKRENIILNWLSLHIWEWEIYWLLWPNGVWKTTLINCVLWFTDIQEGQIFFGWKKISQKVLDKIWYVPDQTQYFKHMTGWEMILFIGKLSRITKNKLTKTAEELLEEVWLFFAKDLLISDYSAGMKKRLWIVLSLLHDPIFLIRDEPMAWLDPLWRIVVTNIMKRLKKQWKTILFSTHILYDAEQICDRVWILFNGKFIFEDYISNLSTSLEDLFKQQILNKIDQIK